MARAYAGMDQEQLALASGIHRNTIGNYETGNVQRPKRIYCNALADAMGVDREWLFTGEPLPPGGGGRGLDLYTATDLNCEPAVLWPLAA